MIVFHCCEFSFLLTMPNFRPVFPSFHLDKSVSAPFAAFRGSGGEMVRSCSDGATHVCSWSCVGASSAESKVQYQCLDQSLNCSMVLLDHETFSSCMERRYSLQLTVIFIRDSFANYFLD